MGVVRIRDPSRAERAVNEGDTTQARTASKRGASSAWRLEIGKSSLATSSRTRRTRPTRRGRARRSGAAPASFFERRGDGVTRRPEVTAKAKARPARTADAQSRIDAARRHAATKRVEASLAARRAREETFRPRLNHQTSRSWEDVKPRLLAPSRRARDATRAPKRDDDLEACSFRPHLVAQCPAYIHAMADASRASKRAEPAAPPPPKPMFFHGRD